MNKVKIVRLRDQGKSLQHIGRIVGLTGERVRQLERIWGLSARGRTLKKRIERKCLNRKCNKVMNLLERDGRKHCCRKCALARFPKRSVAEQRKIWREKHSRYYHEVMMKRKGFKAYVKRCNDKYQKNKNK